MKILKKILVVFLCLLIVLAISAFILWNSSIPSKLIKEALKKELAAMGFQHSSFVIKNISTTGTTISDISFTEDSRLKISEITCRYTLEDLLDGKIKKVEINKGQYLVLIKNGKPDLGLPEIKGSGGELPLESLKIKDFVLRVDNEGEFFEEKISVSLTTSGQNFDAVGSFTGEPVSGNFNGQISKLFDVFDITGKLTLGGKSLSKMLPSLGEGLQFKSGIDFHITGRKLDKDPKADIELKFNGFDFANKEWGIFIKNLRGNFKGYYPLDFSRKPEGEIFFDEADIGKIIFNDGVFKAELESFDNVLIEKMSADLLGGRIHAVDFYLGLSKLSANPEIFFDELDLSQMLEWLTGGKLTGKGKVNGQFEVNVPEWPLLFIEEGGYLSAKGDPGILMLKNSSLIEGMLKAHSGQNAENAQLLVEALTKYRYDELRLDIVKKDNKTVASIFTRGIGGESDKKRPVGGLTINIHNFDESMIALILSNQAFVKWKDNIENMTQH